MTVRHEMKVKTAIFLTSIVLTGCTTTKALCLSPREFTSIWATEASNTHTKEVATTADGEVHLTYAVKEYNASTGKSYWQTTHYWTWEKDLSDGDKNNIRQK